jgi:conjugal transfer pilus assembly protein TraK
MYQSASLDGFDILPSRMDAVMIGTLKVQMISEYRGASLAGRVLKIENKGREPVSLGEGTIAPSNAIAVSVANPQLKPGEATTAYIVTPAGLANGARP